MKQKPVCHTAEGPVIIITWVREGLKDFGSVTMKFTCFSHKAPIFGKLSLVNFYSPLSYVQLMPPLFPLKPCDPAPPITGDK